MKSSACHILTSSLVLLLFLAFSRSTHAEEPLWEVRLDVARTYASPLGQWAMKKVLAEEPKVADKIDAFVKAIGIDPRTEVGELAIYGASFAPSDITLVAKLGTNTGNLEGWVLAAPGYRSNVLDEETALHSFVIEEVPDQLRRIWCAIPQRSNSEDFVLIASFDERQTVNLARQVRSGSFQAKENSPNQLLTLKINDLSSAPLDLDNNMPGAAAVRTIKAVTVDLASSEEELTAGFRFEATSPAKARQLSQLLAGLQAMVQLAPIDEDKDARKAAAMLDKLVVEHKEGDTQLTVDFTALYDDLEDLVD